MRRYLVDAWRGIWESEIGMGAFLLVALFGCILVSIALTGSVSNWYLVATAGITLAIIVSLVICRRRK